MPAAHGRSGGRAHPPFSWPPICTISGSLGSAHVERFSTACASASRACPWLWECLFAYRLCASRCPCISAPAGVKSRAEPSTACSVANFMGGSSSRAVARGKRECNRRVGVKPKAQSGASFLHPRRGIRYTTMARERKVTVSGTSSKSFSTVWHQKGARRREGNPSRLSSRREVFGGLRVSE